MIDRLHRITDQPWSWEWVPNAEDGERVRREWTALMVDRFAEWTRDGLAAARAAWPSETGVDFPFTPDVVGGGTAEWLLSRADVLPAWARLAWGVAWVNGEPRFAPVPVVVEFCEPRDADPDYLMETVGATGMDGDAREPVIDYVTTPLGDGVRVFALARTSDQGAYARVNAAMRLSAPPEHGGGSDVLFTTRVFELPLMALIGSGVEQLMHRIAADSATPEGGTP